MGSSVNVILHLQKFADNVYVPLRLFQVRSMAGVHEVHPLDFVNALKQWLRAVRCYVVVFTSDN